MTKQLKSTGFSLNKAFAINDITPMHLKLDGELCYAPTEFDENGMAIAFDVTKPITFDVICATSKRGEQLKSIFNEKKDSLDARVKHKKQESKQDKEERNVMLAEFAASLVTGWNNVEEAFNTEDCREFMLANDDVVLQVLLHSGEKANYRKK